MDHATGKSRKLSEKDMSEMQDLLAEELNMQRGQSKSETGFEHREREEFILHKLEEKKEDVKKILTDMQTKLIEAKDAQKQDILRAGKALYAQTKKDISN